MTMQRIQLPEFKFHYNDYAKIDNGFYRGDIVRIIAMDNYLYSYNYTVELLTPRYSPWGSVYYESVRTIENVRAEWLFPVVLGCDKCRTPMKGIITSKVGWIFKKEVSRCKCEKVFEPCKARYF